MSTTVELLACNGLPGEARLFWVNGDDEVDYGVVESGSTRVQSTFKEQRWRLRCEKPSAEVECTTSDEAEQHLLLTEASCRQKPTTRPAPQGGPLMSHHLTHPSFRRRLESRLAGAPAPASCLSEAGSPRLADPLRENALCGQVLADLIARLVETRLVSEEAVLALLDAHEQGEEPRSPGLRVKELVAAMESTAGEAKEGGKQVQRGEDGAPGEPASTEPASAVTLHVSSNRAGAMELLWLSGEGEEIWYAQILQGETHRQQTSSGAKWRVRDSTTFELLRETRCSSAAKQQLVVNASSGGAGPSSSQDNGTPTSSN